MLVRVLSALGAMAMLASFANIAQADTIDCRIRAMPPAQYTGGKVAGVTYKGLPLDDLQRLYRRLSGQGERAAGLDYCADPLGFVYPAGKAKNQTIFYPTNVSARCQQEVIEHEEAHVRGWGINHPGAHIQQGPCRKQRG